MLHDKATTSQPLALIRAGSRGGDGTPSPILAAGGGGLDLAGGPPRAPLSPSSFTGTPTEPVLRASMGREGFCRRGGAPLKRGGRGRSLVATGCGAPHRPPAFPKGMSPATLGHQSPPSVSIFNMTTLYTLAAKAIIAACTSVISRSLLM